MRNSSPLTSPLSLSHPPWQTWGPFSQAPLSPTLPLGPYNPLALEPLWTPIGHPKTSTANTQTSLHQRTISIKTKDG